MNKIVVGLVALVISSTTICYADTIRVPFSVKSDSFKKDMKEHGIDFSGTDDSDGEITQVGGFKVITYKPMTPEQMDLIKDSCFRNARK